MLLVAFGVLPLSVMSLACGFTLAPSTLIAIGFASEVPLTTLMISLCAFSSRVTEEYTRSPAFESVLELPRALIRYVRVPWDMPEGPLQTEVLNPELIARGLMVAKPPKAEGEEDDEDEFIPWDERPPVFAQKLRLLFDAKYPEVGDFTTEAVWAAGDILLGYGGNFNTYVTTRELTKQEGLIFRHLLRLILLLEEFQQLTPAGVEPAVR